MRKGIVQAQWEQLRVQEQAQGPIQQYLNLHDLLVRDLRVVGKSEKVSSPVDLLPLRSRRSHSLERSRAALYRIEKSS